MKREEIKEEIPKSYLAYKEKLGGEPNPLALAREAVKRYYYETWCSFIIHNNVYSIYGSCIISIIHRKFELQYGTLGLINRVVT